MAQTRSYLTEKVQIRLPKDLLRIIDAKAKPRLMSRSDIVREAILTYLQNRQAASA